MADIFRHGERVVTINADFVRGEARRAVRQFFRPITAAFEVSHPRSDQKSVLMVDRVHFPKASRVKMRGYAVKKRESDSCR